MAALLLKKSYQLSNLKEVAFKDLWGTKGVFTTMRMVGKPSKLLLLKPHVDNLIKSSKKYGIRKKNLKNIVIDLIKKNTLYKGPDNLFRIALNKRLVSVSIRKRLKPKKNPVKATDEKLFSEIVSAAFGQRRKTIRNSLKPFMSSEQLEKAGIDPGIRPEKVSLNQFIDAANLVSKTSSGLTT